MVAPAIGCQSNPRILLLAKLWAIGVITFEAVPLDTQQALHYRPAQMRASRRGLVVRHENATQHKEDRSIVRRCGLRGQLAQPLLDSLEAFVGVHDLGSPG